MVPGKLFLFYFYLVKQNKPVKLSTSVPHADLSIVFQNTRNVALHTKVIVVLPENHRKVGKTKKKNWFVIRWVLKYCAEWNPDHEYIP